MLTRYQLQITQNLHILYEYYVYNERYSEWPLSDPSRNFHGLTEETQGCFIVEWAKLLSGLGGSSPSPPRIFKITIEFSD